MVQIINTTFKQHFFCLFCFKIFPYALIKEVVHQRDKQISYFCLYRLTALQEGSKSLCSEERILASPARSFIPFILIIRVNMKPYLIPHGFIEHIY